MIQFSFSWFTGIAWVMKIGKKKKAENVKKK
jgi:hypothetical protein